ncbi:MAG: methionine aminotransferase [Fimbriimonadaceae bacterium]|nr:methionine aminotransferase [Chitinophagales bacterium]
MQIKSKLPNVGTSIFTKMTALANEHEAINLAQGFPNFPSSKKLIDLVYSYMKKGMNQYAPMPGLMQLRVRIAEKYFDIYNIQYNPETEITITSGATQAIYTSIAALVYEGDEVIIFEPAYDCYSPAIRLHGAIPVAINLTTPDFSIDWEMVKKKINSKTKMIMLNTPHNPTGTVLGKRDMQELEKIVSSTDIIILSDEVYEHIIFDDLKHESILNYPKLAERSLAIYSFGKTYHNTGWKMGYVLAPKELTREFRAVHQFLVFAANTPIQYALADFIQDKNEYLYVNEFYQEKRNLFLDLIKSSRFTFTPASGTYFQLLDYSGISDKNDTEFADELTIKNKVAGIPLSPFYKTPPNNKVLRFCFAKTDKTLEQAAEILCRI